MAVIPQALAGFPADSPPGCPLIGWHNLVTAAGVTSTTAAAGFPINNVANPATHLKWEAGVNTGAELITITTLSADPIDYVAVAKHNWNTVGASVSIETTDSPPITLIAASVPADNGPIIFRFTPQVLSSVAIRITGFTLPPEAAVIYCGRLLVLERSIMPGRGHTPITYGRQTTVVNGLSESGNFLGRIVLGETRISKADFEWFTPQFYRSDIDEFLDAAQEAPFFWAWSPNQYPGETGYCWLTNDADPVVDPITQRVALTLEMRGVA